MTEDELQIHIAQLIANAPEPCDHQWDGPWWRSEDGCSESITCSRCGMSALDHSVRYGI